MRRISVSSHRTTSSGGSGAGMERADSSTSRDSDRHDEADLVLEATEVMSSMTRRRTSIRSAPKSAEGSPTSGDVLVATHAEVRGGMLGETRGVGHSTEGGFAGAAEAVRAAVKSAVRASPVRRRAGSSSSGESGASPPSANFLSNSVASQLPNRRNSLVLGQRVQSWQDYKLSKFFGVDIMDLGDEQWRKRMAASRDVDLPAAGRNRAHSDAVDKASMVMLQVTHREESFSAQKLLPANRTDTVATFIEQVVVPRFDMDHIFSRDDTRIVLVVLEVFLELDPDRTIESYSFLQNYTEVDVKVVIFDATTGRRRTSRAGELGRPAQIGTYIVKQESLRDSAGTSTNSAPGTQSSWSGRSSAARKEKSGTRTVRRRLSLGSGKWFDTMRTFGRTQRFGSTGSPSVGGSTTSSGSSGAGSAQHSKASSGMSSARNSASEAHVSSKEPTAPAREEKA